VEGFRGIGRAEAEASFGECVLPEELGDEGWWPGHMEDDTSLWKRAGQAAEALRSLAGSADNKVAVIAHGTFTSRLISRLLECGPAPYSRFAMMNCSVTTLEVTDTKVRLLGANDVSHLPVSLRT
jgi:broad specificity phosphatase PhoE